MQRLREFARRLTLLRVFWGIAAVAIFVFAIARFDALALIAACGAIALWVREMAGAKPQEHRHRERSVPTRDREPISHVTRSTPSTNRERSRVVGVQPRSPSALVNEMMLQGRYAVLLRPEVLTNLSQIQADQAAELLTQQMAMIRGGRVVTQPDADDLRRQTQLIEVPPFFVDRHAVTNGAFQEFVDLDGYRKPEFWAEEVRDSLELFVDTTNHPGPRFWTDGHYDTSLTDHPVVGICWYEADAYARWAGKRLPTDAEWVKAALSPRTSMITTGPKRRYPWGDTFSSGKANLWSASKGTTVGVAEFTDGTTTEGVCQMVGNVWEWMAGPLASWRYSGELAESCAEYRSLRGGAFDTYIESQASPLAPSGDSAFARKPNIGFRCVLDLDSVPASIVPIV